MRLKTSVSLRRTTASSATAAAGSNAPSAFGGQTATWSYDSYGNRTLEAFSGVACTGSNPTPQIKAVYNQANNRIQSVSGTTSATFSYDASGNTLYDGINRYWYDAEGARIAKATVFPRYVTAHFALCFVR